jgi:hypothetical protein
MTPYRAKRPILPNRKVFKMDFEIPSDLKNRIVELSKHISMSKIKPSEKELWELILRSVVSTLELLKKQEVIVLLNDQITVKLDDTISGKDKMI